MLLLLLAWMWIASVRAVIVCMGRQRPQVLKGALAVTAMLAVGFFRTLFGERPVAESAGYEVHPELSFHQLNGDQPLRKSKHLGVGRAEVRHYGSMADHARTHGLDAAGLRRSVTGFLQ